jgi:hypothetical protein
MATKTSASLLYRFSKIHSDRRKDGISGCRKNGPITERFFDKHYIYVKVFSNILIMILVGLYITYKGGQVDSETLLLKSGV